jgi:hypothetical protein
MNIENCLFLMIIELLIDTFLISYSTCSRVSVVFLLTYCDIMYRVYVYGANKRRKRNSLSIPSGQLYMYVNDIKFLFFFHHIQMYIYILWYFVVFSRLDDAFNFFFEMLPTARQLNQPTSICY